MSYAYPRSTGASSLPSYQSSSSQLPSYISQALNRVPGAKQWVEDGVASIRSQRPRGRDDFQTSTMRTLKRLFTVANGVILMWIFTLWWGERTVFQEHIDACVWDNWEHWPENATPHHVAFVADPQLVDPHTYPGRPWPLSTLTVKYTDQYLRRSFSSIQKNLVPDSVLFLGDLFDGGREWATRTTSSPEDRYKKIDDTFWRKEYRRFVRIFIDPWLGQDVSPADGRGRKMIASLPGNHDLGFGNGVLEPVRDRFQSYFGDSNRVDVIGNHTFVSIDTVSLSAMDQPDPLTGSTTPTSSDDPQNRPIWKDADEFLDKIPTTKAKAEMEEIMMLQNKTDSTNVRFDHHVVDATENSIHHKPNPKSKGFPTILLTHVPLYRQAATPCGPLRERYPPSGPDLEEDEPNSLKIQGGYQYQNVLTSKISTELVSKAGPNVVQVYSGDDHDYCEVVHREFNGSPNEITVKSLSWAMGVRRPGFVLTSLWNPIDPITGDSLQNNSPLTIQNHLCILPDQLGIFIHYGCVLLASVVILFINSIYHVKFSPESLSNGSVLPLSERRSYSPRHQYQTSGTSSSTLSSPGGLASRNGNIALPRYPMGGVPGTKNAHDAYRGLDRADMKDKPMFSPAQPKGLRQTAVSIGRDLLQSIKFVASIVLFIYFFLIWRW
ncbi:uncharacterized protein N7469_009190 [Penicillium citrinum]|uniref:Calcineurin-like phosphoesterase domain-containing protein n=1 Tax=Penicillium citrinum TaxID=5077 RepID=A0A9W9TIX5_PENCI|nr:uncharacterized protein N7469_009190 [Penicillium citrinum]KAJ5222950.1 hypothetical protein N7469_009190 [Penicillium citrinum]